MTPPAKADKAAKPVPEITVLGNRCKGCEFCVTFCPKDVLKMEGGLPVAEAPERCTRCELCVWVCPDFAIRIS